MTANQVAALRAQEDKRSNLENERLNSQRNYLTQQQNIVAAKKADTDAQNVARQKARDQWERSIALQSELRQQTQGNRRLDIETANAVTSGIGNVTKSIGSVIGAVGALFA